MRVTRVEAAASRERVLDAAARLFRERGLDGVGVADIMKSAGLTHGGFYGHFDSKEDLMAQACLRAFDSSAERWRKAAARSGARALPGIVKSYLSTRHRDAPGAGCAVATLATDAVRQGPQVRRALTQGVLAQVETLARLVPGRTSASRRRKALAAYAAMVGAMVLARAVDDPKLSEEILAAAAASIA
jgi:TetR/AcrR family transcriptional repressor of nem operon